MSVYWTLLFTSPTPTAPAITNWEKALPGDFSRCDSVIYGSLDLEDGERAVLLTAQSSPANASVSVEMNTV